MHNIGAFGGFTHKKRHLTAGIHPDSQPIAFFQVGFRRGAEEESKWVACGKGRAERIVMEKWGVRDRGQGRLKMGTQFSLFVSPVLRIIPAGPLTCGFCVIYIQCMRMHGPFMALNVVYNASAHFRCKHRCCRISNLHLLLPKNSNSTMSNALVGENFHLAVWQLWHFQTNLAVKSGIWHGNFSYGGVYWRIML